jgi:light-regulated signal transduction histidine kinase (bacteriophytochrome)
MRGYLNEKDRELIQLHEEFRRDIHMKKHAIGQTLHSFSNWWGALQQARREGDGIVSDLAVVGKASKYEVRAIYDTIDRIVKTLAEQVDKFDRGYHQQSECFILAEYIKDYITNNQSTMFEYEYDGSCAELEDYDTEYENVIHVDFAKSALKIILDNIVSNACCHGFEADREGNIIRISLTRSGDSCVMDVSNNGAALHSKLPPSEVFVYGRSSKFGSNTSTNSGHHHCGIGGYEVKQLMREFGGSAEFISNPDDEFPITYRLTFKIANFNTETNGDVQGAMDR